MAWLKNITEERTGAIAPFWEVISIVYNHREEQSDLTVGGWVSEDAYNEGKDPIITKNWSISSGLAPELSAGAISFVTSYARAQDEFEGSEEVI